MPVALILVDALSASYPQEGVLPSVAELARGGLACPMANMYAYRGIEATLFTGSMPVEHGVWGEFRPASQPETGGIRGHLGRAIINLGDLLPSDRLRLDVRYVVSKLNRQRHLPTGNLIPASIMPLFRGSVDTDIWAQGSLPVPTLFDDLRAAGGSFENVVYPVINHDTQVISRVRARLLESNLPDFWYIKFSALDALGHKYGPVASSLAPALSMLDAQISELTSALRAAYGSSLDIVLLSDHGMSAVREAVDVRPLLAASRLKVGLDYLYFLDSTTLRLWSESPRPLTVLRDIFADTPGMWLLESSERAALGLPDDEATGDILIALDEGRVFFPDFFRRQEAPLGMHGYANVVTRQGLPYLAAGPRISSLIDSAGGELPGHADVWSAMRRNLGLASVERAPVTVNAKGAAICAC